MVKKNSWKSLNISGKKKEDYVTRVLARIETVHRNLTMVQRVVKFVEKKQFPDPAPLHDFYRAHFNLVDLTDRYWYKVQENHGNWKWRSKMLFSIMRFAMINVWVCSS